MYRYLQRIRLGLILIYVRLGFQLQPFLQVDTTQIILNERIRNASQSRILLLLTHTEVEGARQGLARKIQSTSKRAISFQQF